MDRPREPLPTRVDDTPELPTAYARALETGLDTLSLTLSPAARAAIDGHVRLLLAWTEAINLTGIREPAAVATAHVVEIGRASVGKECTVLCRSRWSPYH